MALHVINKNRILVYATILDGLNIISIGAHLKPRQNAQHIGTSHVFINNITHIAAVEITHKLNLFIIKIILFVKQYQTISQVPIQDELIKLAFLLYGQHSSFLMHF